MPVFRSGPGRAPAWCEMESFDLVELDPGQTHAFSRLARKEKLIVANGKCRVAFGGRTVDAGVNANLDLAGPDDHFEIVEITEPVALIRLCGRWGEEVGGSGLFDGKPAAPYDPDQDAGDPVDYPKNTHVDCHFHDCDEYWIIFQGTAEAVTEGKHFPIGPGDCVATGMGHHHDIPIAHGVYRAVYFETTMEGRKRHGHLWEHAHGPAEPDPLRV